MELERLRATVLRGTFHTYELAALTAAARYLVETAPADVPAESLEQLEHLLADYDEQVRHLTSPTDRAASGHGPHGTPTGEGGHGAASP